MKPLSSCFAGQGQRLAVVTEVQKDPPEPGKRWDWPAYLAIAARRHRCYAVLLVIALQAATARASSKTIRVGHPGFDLTPDPERRAAYTRLIHYTAPPAVRRHLEKLMKTVLRDEFIDGYIDQGRAEGEARMLLRVIAARGFSVPDDIRERVTSCTDVTQLEEWADRAVVAATLEEIFTG
jgi:hypothetical protein